MKTDYKFWIPLSFSIVPVIAMVGYISFAFPNMEKANNTRDIKIQTLEQTVSTHNIRLVTI